MSDCVIPGCGQPEARVVDGQSYCASHGPAALTAADLCTICGKPATTQRGASPLCDDHAARGS